MGTKLEELFIELSAKTEKLESGLRQAVTGMEKAGEKMTKSGEKTSAKTKASFFSMSNAATIMSGVIGGNIVLGAFTRLSRFVKDAFGNMRQFSRGISEINTLLPRNAKLTKETSDEFLRLARTYGKSAQSQVGAFYDIVSAGIEGTRNQMALLTSANVAAVGGLGDVKDTASLLIDIINVYGQENITAAEAADTLFQTVKLGKTTITALSSSMAKVLPLANEMQVSLEEVGAALATMTVQGLTTAERTTQLTALFAAVAKNGEKLGKGLDSTALKTKGLSKFLEDLIVATGGSSDAMFELLGRKEAVQAVLALTSNSLDTFNGKLAEYKNKAGAAVEASLEVQKGLDFKLDKATEQIKTMSVTMLQRLKPAMVSVLTVFSRFLTEGFGSKQEKKILSMNKHIEFVTERIDTLKERLKDEEKGGRGFLSKLFNPGDAENIRKELELTEQSLAKTVKTRNELLAGGGTPDGGGAGGTGPDLTGATGKTKEFTQAQKDAAKAGKQLSEDLAESSSDIEATYTGRLDKIKNTLEQEKQAIAQKQADGLISQEEAIAAEVEMEAKAFENKQAILEERRALEVDQINSAREQGLIEEQAHKDSLAKIEMDHASRMLAENNKAGKTKLANQKKLDDLDKQQRSEFLNTAATLSNSENKKLAAIGKAAALTQIAIKTPTAVGNSFEFGTRLGGPPLGFALAGIAGVAMAAQAANVAGVPLQTGLTEVPAGFPNDSFNSRLTTGERVVNVEQNTDLTSFLNSQKEGGGGSTFNLTVNGISVDSESNGLIIVETIRTFLRDNGGTLA